MHRRNIISDLIKKFNYSSYLELGLRDPSSVFNHIPCNKKHSVDINISTATFKMSTDDFFGKLKSSKLNLDKNFKWDTIFIDANHLADFVKNDIDNSLNHLSDNGIIFIHDILPLKYSDQLEDRGCQTAWKVVPYLLKFRPDLHVCSIHEKNGGLGIIKKNPSRKRATLDHAYNIFYEYYLMISDKKVSQNFIEYEKLLAWINSPFYNFEKEGTKLNLSNFSDPSKIQHIWK